MSNQASEDDLRDELYDLAFLTGADSETGERTLAFIASELSEYVQNLIRTEKLKLLAEVRERVVGDVVCTCGCNFGDGCLCLDKAELRTEQYDLLAKLEAEL